MEVAAAGLGSAVTAAASVAKLTTMIGNRPCEATVKDNAELIKNNVGLIDALCRDAESMGLSNIQTECIDVLSRLAREIEDCLDLFDAEKHRSEDLAGEIFRLNTRSVETRNQILGFLGIAQGTVPGTGTAQGAAVLAGTAQGAAVVPGTAQGAAVLAGTAQGTAGIPPSLQDHFNDKIRRHCLLYFCLFRPNMDVSTKLLMRSWAAEGLVQGQDLAAKNLETFISENIINQNQIISNNWDEDICRPSAEILPFISQVSRSENFVLVCDGTPRMQGGEDALRLSVQPSADARLNLPQDLSRFRTLVVFPVDGAIVARYEAVLDFSKYKVLKVLNLKECGHLTEQQRKKIFDDIIINHPQILMKYLSINLGSIDGITKKIEHLKQLETLDLSGTDLVVTVFREVLMLPKLKHLLGKFQFSIMEMISISDKDLKNFLKDRSVLETLAGFVTGRRYGFPDLMSYMESLRRVKIWCKSSASKSKLGLVASAITEFIRRGINVPNLGRSLSIDFEACSSDFVHKIDVVAGGSLDSLDMRGNIQLANPGKFPLFVAQLSSVKELCLCFTGLRWGIIRDGLLSVGGLKYLKLVEDDLGPINIQPGDLKSINRISIVSSTALDAIAIQHDALPELVSLHILCQHLRVTPGNPGIAITHMKNLKEVALHPDVQPGVTDGWKQAVDGHPNVPVPVLLSIRGP